MAEQWFRALDQRRIRSGAKYWVAHVVGIHSEGGEIWVQIVRNDNPEKSLVLHLSGWTTVDQAIAAMKAHSLKLDVFPRIITALPTV